MNRGSISELILKRSILKHIRKNRKEVSFGAGIGHDYSAIGQQIVAHGIADAGLPYSALDMTVGEAALIRALNQLALSSAEPVGVHIVMLVPHDEEESLIRSEMQCLNRLADENHIQIIGGHTEVSNSVLHLTVSITAYGTLNPDFCVMKPSVGDRILMIGDAGRMGTSLIAASRKEGLEKRFAESYIQKAITDKQDFNITTVVQTVLSNGVKYIHDISFGGIYGAISQMAEMAKLGICIEHEAIPIRQEVIEICEFYNLNPYTLLGAGSFLAVCSNEECKKLTETLQEEGIESSVIGTFTEQKEKIVVSEALNMRRHITPPDGDEIYKIF